jgi:hypothetical protein
MVIRLNRILVISNMCEVELRERWVAEQVLRVPYSSIL